MPLEPIQMTVQKGCATNDPKTQQHKTSMYDAHKFCGTGKDRESLLGVQKMWSCGCHLRYLTAWLSPGLGLGVEGAAEHVSISMRSLYGGSSCSRMGVDRDRKRKRR